MLTQKEDVMIRKMRYCDEDFNLIYKWLNDKEVLKYYGSSKGYSYEQIIGKYGPRALGEDYVIPCIIEYKGKPIGYIQYYELEEAEKNDYGAQEEKGVFGIDIFIGEIQYWNKGIGTKALKLLLKYLFSEKNAVRIFIDPQTWNERAIKVYEKCGFKRIKVIPKHELVDGCYKDNLIMAITKDDVLD